MMLLLKIGVVITVCGTCWAQNDKKWVWGDNSRSAGSSRRDFDRDPRYEVYENEGPITSESIYDRPHVCRPDFRPGGVYGNVPNGNYGHAHPHYPSQNGPETGILTGPVPSWVKDGPFKNYDKCKCTEKFNCNSPGISYGHCDVGKSYCCYATKKRDQIGGPFPSRPHHSLENGVLVGPGGPVDVPRPGGVNRPGGFGLGGPISHRPVHSIENGILVGPGGPFDRPAVGRPGNYGGYGGFGRRS